MTKKRFHKDSRFSENFTEKGLHSLTSQPSIQWIRYILKECIDNSLEACEEPEITVTYNDNVLSIKDNGTGITKRNIYNIFKDIHSFGGNKRHYKLPSRGQQGNALMTILGIQTLLDYPLTVISNSKKYSISVVKNDVSDEYDVEISEENVESIYGLQINIKGSLGQYAQHGLAHIIQNTVVTYSILNPHVSFKIVKNGDEICCFPREEDSGVQSFSLTGNKNTTGKILWFSYDDFKERLKADFRVKPNLKVSDFIKEFYGLTSETKQKNVLAKVDIDRKDTLSVFFDENKIKDNLSYDFYQAMKDETKKFSVRKLNKTLGCIGEKGLCYGLFSSLHHHTDDSGNSIIDNLEDAIKRLSEKGISIDIQDFFVYYCGSKVKETDEKVIPFNFEIVAVPISSEKNNSYSSSQLIFGINQSFLYSNPDIDMYIKIGDRKKPFSGITSVFYTFDYSFMIVCNLTCPTIDFQDKGKQTFDLSPFNDVIADAVGKLVRNIKRKIIPNLNKINDEESSDYHKPVVGKAPSGFIKKTVCSLFKDVYKEATENGKYTIQQRQFFYALRPRFNRIRDERGYKYTYDSSFGNLMPLELNYDTFVGIINKYETKELKERVIYKSDRGFFVEPHSNKRVDLGTSSVKKYISEIEEALKNEYNNLLFVEKTGYYELLHYDFELSKKYDLGIIQCKGWANNAVRELIEEIRKRKPSIKLFVLTDFDISGLGIARNIKEPDELSAIDIFKNVIRLGVTLEDINHTGYNLRPESVSLEKSMVTQLENSFEKGDVTQEQYDFLIKGQRVEINAFTPVKLKDYLEDKFTEHNIKKLVPDDEHVEQLEGKDFGSEKEDAFKLALIDFLLRSTAVKELLTLAKELADTSGYDAEAKLKLLYDRKSLYNEIVKELESFPPISWKKINENKLAERRAKAEDIIDEYRQEISKKVNEVLKDKKIEVQNMRKKR